jgi:hypothetical protein
MIADWAGPLRIVLISKKSPIHHTLSDVRPMIEVQGTVGKDQSGNSFVERVCVAGLQIVPYTGGSVLIVGSLGLVWAVSCQTQVILQSQQQIRHSLVS